MIPPINHPKWKELVTGAKKYEFQSLGVKIMMSRVLLHTSKDLSPDNIKKSIEEVHSFFTKNEAHNQKDLQLIFGKE